MAVGQVSSISEDNWQLIQTNTTTSGTSSTFSGLSGYKAFMLACEFTSSSGYSSLKFNGSTTYYGGVLTYGTGGMSERNAIYLTSGSGTGVFGTLLITNVLSVAPKPVTGSNGANTAGGNINASWTGTDPITSIVIASPGFTSGEIRLYGIAA